ncbi:MAG: hypothetical protein L0241_01540 [Planctomycetia bacterium]|nr:hypothetical protein [Planctomycetia bacterium]
MKPDEPSLEEKRAALTRYIDRGDSGHDYFKLHDGRDFEGYILEVGDTTIVFQWAHSPFAPGESHESFEIPIESIDIRSLR